MQGFRIGVLGGIPIEINGSWLVIFTLLVWSLATRAFPDMYAGMPKATYWLMASFSTVLPNVGV